MSNKIKVASLFRSMQIWVSGWAWKVHATIWTILDQNDFRVSYIQLEDVKPRYEHQWDIINLQKKFYLWFWLKKIVSWFKLARIIKQYCNSNQTNIILWQWDFFFMITWLSKLLWNQAACIWIVHTTLRVRPKFIQNLLGRCLNKNDKVVCISAQEKEYLAWNFWIKESNLTLIHNSISLETIKKQSDEPLEAKEKLLFKKDIFTYISVWRYTYQKNFRLLIDSYKIVYEKNHKTQLIIIWDGEEYNNLSNYIIDLWLENHIKLLWKKNNPIQYMKYADCFVMSSRFEWYPMVLLEACACWLPLVSIDCPTWPAEVIWNNEWGILVKNHNNDKDIINASNLAWWMLKIVNSKREQIWKRNRNFVEQFDNKVIGEKWNDFLKTISH